MLIVVTFLSTFVHASQGTLRGSGLGSGDLLITHSLSESDARDILGNSYMNTFFTNVTGNPYQSVRTMNRSSGDLYLMDDVIRDSAAARFGNESLVCAVGSTKGGSVEPVNLTDFLASRDLQVRKKGEAEPSPRMLL